jgi:uncharacterized protein
MLGVRWKLWVAGVAVVSVASAGVAETIDTAPLDLTFAGGAAGGTFSAVGEAIGEMIRREYPGSSYTYEPGSNAGAILGVANGRYPMGLGAPIEMATAFRGQSPFDGVVPEENITIVARIADGMLGYFLASQAFVNEYGIHSLSDLADKKPPVRISVGQRGNLSVTSQAEAFLQRYSAPAGQIESWRGTLFYYPARQSLDLLRDNRADVVFSAGWYPDARISELARTVGLAFIPMDRSVVDEVADYFGVDTGTIPKDAYPFLEEDYYTTSIGIYIIAGPTAKDRDVYRVAKALHTQIDYLRSVHSAFSQYTAEMLVKAGKYRLHNGAEKYYREVGLAHGASKNSVSAKAHE